MNRKRWIVGTLWLIAVLIGVTLVVEPWQWWSGKSSSDSAVAQYIKSVNAVEQQMHGQLTQMQSAYRNFSAQSSDPKAAAKLAAPVHSLDKLESRISGLKAPPQAAKLQRLLERFVSDEKSIALELEQLGGFMPRFRLVTAVVSAAQARLGRELAAAAPPKPRPVRGTPKKIAAAQAEYAAAARKAEAAQADAVDGYDKVLGAAIRGLRTLHPPLVIAPAYRAELRTLISTRTAGAALSRELRKANTRNVPVLSRRFTEASRISAGVAAQRAEIAAVEAYNARVRHVVKLESQIRGELAHLQRVG